MDVYKVGEIITAQIPYSDNLTITGEIKRIRTKNEETEYDIESESSKFLYTVNYKNIIKKGRIEK